ncbi:MAG: 3-dehydroquinate synthase [Acidimicrobiia bacterium]|nr:3-dehydroquinate synthase [Acidimicrobiia bacterium]
MRRHVILEGDIPVSEIIVGRSLMSEIAQAAVGVSTRVAVLSQPSTKAYGEMIATALQSVGLNTTCHTLPDGEAAKDLAVVHDIYRVLNRAAFTREDLVIGVGGGALTDVTGFVAGTYLRGVPAMYVATTLLAAVDASIGGKTGINVDGKNLAGVFVHPQIVFSDIDVLDTLPHHLKVQGAAEAVKTGFIEDMEIVQAYEATAVDAVDLEFIVNRSVAVKVAVVTEDFTEQGRRAILNYGHTVGHAIETASGMSHGEAVAIGMVSAGAASHAVTGFNGEGRQSELFGKIGLPTRVDQSIEVDRVRALMASDKKRDTSGLRMVLLKEFGVPVVEAVDDATVRVALDAVGLSP